MNIILKDSLSGIRNYFQNNQFTFIKNRVNKHLKKIDKKIIIEDNRIFCNEIKIGLQSAIISNLKSETQTFLNKIDIIDFKSTISICKKSTKDQKKRPESLLFECILKSLDKLESTRILGFFKIFTK